MKYTVIANKIYCHCERSEAIQGLLLSQQRYGLPRYARNDEHAALHSIFMRL